VTGRKTLLLIKRKDARRCRLQSPPMQSEAIGGSSHYFSTKHGQNPLKIPENVTAPLSLGLLLRLFKDSLFLRRPPTKTYPRQIADIMTEPLCIASSRRRRLMNMLSNGANTIKASVK